MKKYFAAFSLLLCVACSSPTGPYSLGGRYYVAPGKFAGTWVDIHIIDLSTEVLDTTLCEATISQADSVLVGTITNTTTGVTLNLRGRIYLGSTVEFLQQPLISYLIVDGASTYVLNFPTSGESFEYGFDNNNDSGKFISTSIECTRR